MEMTDINKFILISKIDTIAMCRQSIFQRTQKNKFADVNFLRTVDNNGKRNIFAS